ncbi:hypothetical protein DDE82_000938 [Stemphylium lycopersici]|nr:hypothetical protein DDE82_000938 [Stemphylium lycopersici]
MPFIASKAAASFSWDNFPPPLPEAESCFAPGTPPADSIPKPGALPDRRFNRDPGSDRRSKTFKRGKNYLGAGQAGSNTSDESVSSAAVGTNGLGSGLGAWYSPAPRATGYPRDPITIANSTKPTVYHTITPDLPMVPGRSASPSKKAVPAWAAALEKALTEDRQKTTVQTAVFPSVAVKADPENEEKSLADQNLKAKTRLSNGVACASLQMSPGATAGASSAATVYATLAKREDFVKDEGLARALATTEVGTEGANDVLHLQTAMVQKYDGSQPTNEPNGPGWTDHGYKVKTMLIRAMEHELDLEKVASERSLTNMSSSELGKYFDKVCSAHKSWWDAEKRTQALPTGVSMASQTNMSFIG